MTADDFTNMVEAEIDWRIEHPLGECCCVYYVDLVQVCDCAYSEMDGRDRCASCGVKYREVGNG